MNQYEKLATLAARGIGLWRVVSSVYTLLFLFTVATKLSAVGTPFLCSIIAGVAIFALAKPIGRLIGSDLE
jgi:hypothetical protein